jgi:peroxiredoxin
MTRRRPQRRQTHRRTELRLRAQHRLVIVVLGLLGCVLLDACSQEPPAHGSTFQLLRIGAAQPGDVYPISKRLPVATYVGRLLNEEKFSLRGALGAVTVISWWASWCGPCTTEIPQYDLLYRQLLPRDVHFIGIDIKDEHDAASSFVADNHISFPVVSDEAGAAALRLGVGNVSGPPFTMLLDAEGRVAAVYIGAQADVSLSSAIRKLLP